MLAPMEGVSHPDFRAIIAERGGVGVVCTEFVRISRAPLNPGHITKEVVRFPGVPLSVQVMGNEADKMAEAAGLIADAGADIVDINLGCPMPRVVRKGVGAAMLKDPKLLYEVVSSMREKVKGILSAKIRAGFDEADHVVHIAKTVERAGADFLIVHPRRRRDFYEGVADWRIISVLKEELDIPVVGNGDAWYASDVLRMQEQTGCDAVMLGRPALRNPWIFEQAAALRRGDVPFAPSGQDVCAYLRDVAGRYEHSGNIRNIPGKLKELLRYLGRTVPDEGVGIKALLRLRTTEELLEGSERLFAHLPPEGLDLDAHGRYRIEDSGEAKKND